MKLRSKKILIIATSNRDRFNKNKKILKNVSPNLIIRCIDRNLKKPKENGGTEKENAILKAEHYHNILNKPVLCIDDGVYLNGQDTNEQMGLNIHRLGRHKDEPKQDIYNYWFDKIKCEPNLSGRWERAVAICVSNNIFTKVLSRKVKFVLPKKRDSYISGNPLNYFMIPDGCSTTLQKMNGGERKKHEKEITNIFKLLLEQSGLI